MRGTQDHKHKILLCHQYNFPVFWKCQKVLEVMPEKDQAGRFSS